MHIRILYTVTAGTEAPLTRVNRESSLIANELSDSRCVGENGK